MTERLVAFHDAELLRVEHKAFQKVLQLGFSTASGKFQLLELNGLVTFRIVDMGMQNVVSRLLVHGINIEFDAQELEERVRWISTSSEGEQLLDGAALNRLVETIRLGEAALFLLEPSWGAELVAIAGSLTIQE